MKRDTVILLHSSGASARQWDALAQTLAPRFEVRAIDLHGHGRQVSWHAARPLTLDDEAELVTPAVDAADRVHLIGHSYGGAVALHVAAARPTQVRSVAVYEPVLFRLLADHEPHGDAAREVDGVAQAMRTLLAAGDAESAAQRFVDYWSGAPAWAGLPASARASIVARMPTVAQHFDALHASAWTPRRLARLTMPLLCLSGGRSTAAALRIAALLRRHLPTARHETLDRLGHLAPITHAAVVNERLQRFLEGDVVKTPPRTATLV